MSGKRCREDFKIEAAKQVTDRGYKLGEVASRLGVTTKSLLAKFFNLFFIHTHSLLLEKYS